MKGISVVIPNYNGKDLLKQILPALYVALQQSSLPYEIIISDDASRDGSVAYLQQQFPEITLITSANNSGFSPTINRGIFKTKYDYVLLLNSDVLILPDYFSRQLQYFEKPDTFGVMGRIVGWDDDIIQDGGKYPAFHGAKIKTSGNFIPLNEGDNGWFYSMYLSGANALVDRKKLLLLEGFDEIFAPFYVEDFELSVRAWRLGWKCYYEHNAVCRHKVSASIKSKETKDFVNTIYYRNKMYLHAIHLQGIRLVLWYAQLIPETLIRLITFRTYYLKAMIKFFSNRKSMLRSKERFESLKGENNLLSIKEVAALITSSLEKKSIKRF